MTKLKRLVAYLDGTSTEWIVASWKRPQIPRARAADRGEALARAVEIAGGGCVMVDFKS